MKLRFLLFYFFLSACQTSVVTQSLDEPVINDQLAYFKELKKQRPQLVLDDCKNNLIVKTKYRDSVLSGAIDFAAIKKEQYTQSLQSIDKLWADEFRASALEIRQSIDQKIRAASLDPENQRDKRVWKLKASLPFYVADYLPEKFVGYHTGNLTDYDKNGLGRKIYLEFKSAIDDLNSKSFLAFTEALHQAGFNGDSKVQLALGVARFQINNIVIHAGSLSDAIIAEKVARDFFKGELVSIGRGLDIKRSRETFDWSWFLCTQDITTLPPAAFSYLSYEK